MKPTLEQLVSELQKRKTQPFRLENLLFKEQLEFVKDPARFKIAITTRRAGKTVSCAADLIYTALETTDVVCLYITLARTNAKRLLWPELKRINRKFVLGFDFNESELSATAPNGSIIYLSGASDRTEIEKFRGLPIRLCYVDEGQSFPTYIEELLDEVVGPALMDHAGSLVLIGTPGPVPTGYFFECSLNPEWSHHFWSFFDNHHLPALKKGFTHQDLLNAELKRTGLKTTDPKIQREWFGKWVLDTDSLVYKYDERINHYEELPDAKYTYILGVDLGFNDADALAVLAWSDSSPCTYLVEELVTRKQGITELVQQIITLRDKYAIAKIVVDTGGLGKKISEELSRRYQIGVQAAEKVRKVEYIELMNDVLRTGKLKAKKTSQFANDCLKVEWDGNKSSPDKKVISNRFHSDICEAVLYAWRESYGFTHQPEVLPPAVGSKEWTDKLEEEAFEHFSKLEDIEKEWGFK